MLIEPILRELAGLSLRAIAAEVDRRGIKSWSGRPWNDRRSRPRWFVSGCCHHEVDILRRLRGQSAICTIITSFRA